MDTYLMYPAFIMCVSHAVLDILFVKTGGAGRHAVALTMGEFVMSLKLTVVSEFAYPLSVTLPKLAILSLYLRVFTAKSFRYMCFAVIGIITLSYLATVVSVCLMCTPFAYNWNKTIPGGHCGLIETYRWPSVPNVVTDLAILLMPLPTIWHLHTSVNQKIGLTITFLTGSVGIVTAIVRLAVFFTADMFADITWHCIEFLTWTTIEPGIYLIAACLPSLRPLFRKMFKDCDFGSIWAQIRSYAFKIPRQTNDSQAVSLNAINAARKTTLMVVDPSPDFKQLEENNSSIYSGDDRRGFMA